MRFRIVIDVDTTDPEMTYLEVLDAARRAELEVRTYLGTAWVELDQLEERGT